MKPEDDTRNDDPPPALPADDDTWMHLSLNAPHEVVRTVLELLQQQHGFVELTEIDWCALERQEDFAHVDYGPAPEAGNQYRIDWRRGETRGDIVVEVQEGADHEH